MYNMNDNIDVTAKKNERDAVVVWCCKIARKLLKLGYTIIDIKPARENRERSVFVFRNENNIDDVIHDMLKEEGIINN